MGERTIDKPIVVVVLLQWHLIVAVDTNNPHGFMCHHCLGSHTQCFHDLELGLVNSLIIIQVSIAHKVTLQNQFVSLSP